MDTTHLLDKNLANVHEHLEGKGLKGSNKSMCLLLPPAPPVPLPSTNRHSSGNQSSRWTCLLSLPEKEAHYSSNCQPTPNLHSWSSQQMYFSRRALPQQSAFQPHAKLPWPCLSQARCQCVLLLPLEDPYQISNLAAGLGKLRNQRGCKYNLLWLMLRMMDGKRFKSIHKKIWTCLKMISEKPFFFLRIAARRVFIAVPSGAAVPRLTWVRRGWCWTVARSSFWMLILGQLSWGSLIQCELLKWNLSIEPALNGFLLLRFISAALPNRSSTPSLLDASVSASLKTWLYMASNFHSSLSPWAQNSWTGWLDLSKVDNGWISDLGLKWNNPYSWSRWMNQMFPKFKTMAGQIT